jgi:hypothetical protein
MLQCLVVLLQYPCFCLFFFYLFQLNL